MNEQIDEELKIMEERSRNRQIGPDIFTRPIADICYSTISLVNESDPLEKAIAIMQERRIGAIGVIREGQLTGIVTERDLLFKVTGKVDDYRARPVSQFMTANPTWLLKSDSIVYCMNKMYVGGYRHIPILDEDGRPTHMVSLRHVLRFFFEYFPEDIINVASDPYRGPARRYGG